MSDPSATDDANLSELTDDDKLTSEFPPEEPLGVEEYGITAREQAVPEALDERVAREEPDVVPVADEAAVGTIVEPEAELGPDLTAEAVGSEVLGAPDRLDPDDLSSGDSTLRDVAQERSGGQSAEESAMHLTGDPPMGDGDGYVDE